VKKPAPLSDFAKLTAGRTQEETNVIGQALVGALSSVTAALVRKWMETGSPGTPEEMRILVREWRAVQRENGQRLIKESAARGRRRDDKDDDILVAQWQEQGNPDIPTFVKRVLPTAKRVQSAPALEKRVRRLLKDRGIKAPKAPRTKTK
jgi:hypothetical protein